MAQVISTEEMFFTAFEPKTANRFIMYMDGVALTLLRVLLVPILLLMYKQWITSISKKDSWW